MVAQRIVGVAIVVLATFVVSSAVRNRARWRVPEVAPLVILQGLVLIVAGLGMIAASFVFHA